MSHSKFCYCIDEALCLSGPKAFKPINLATIGYVTSYVLWKGSIYNWAMCVAIVKWVAFTFCLCGIVRQNRFVGSNMLTTVNLKRIFSVHMNWIQCIFNFRNFVFFPKVCVQHLKLKFNSNNSTPPPYSNWKPSPQNKLFQWLTNERT